jgi:iron complex transport system substrate-binding protein
VRRLFYLALLLFAALLAVACKRPARAGRGVRIVSLSPSTTEALFAIGAGALVVGRSRYCDYPPDALRLPQVGGYVDPNLEAILALEPTLVTGARGPAGSGTVDALAARGIATYFPVTESLAEIDAMILGLGERTGHVEQARALTLDVDTRIARVERAVAGRAKPKALLVFGLEPIVVAGPRSFADEMLARAGAANAVSAGSGYPTLGLETVLALDPDVVLDASMEESRGAPRIVKDAPGWGRLRAVKEGRVATLADEVVLRPGPRVPEGLARIARAVHPEASIP